MTTQQIPDHVARNVARWQRAHKARETRKAAETAARQQPTLENFRAALQGAVGRSFGRSFGRR